MELHALSRRACKQGLQVVQGLGASCRGGESSWNGAKLAAKASSAAAPWFKTPAFAVGLAPNKACTAASSRPCIRANCARLAMSGSGASLVMTLILLPRGTTCKPWPGASKAARCCRWALSVCPFNTWAKSLFSDCPEPVAGVAGAALGSLAAGETGRLAKKLRFGSINTPLHKKATSGGEWPV